MQQLLVATDTTTSFTCFQARIRAFLSDYRLANTVVTVYYYPTPRQYPLTRSIRWLMPGEALPPIDTTTLLIERADDGLMIVHVGGPAIDLVTLENPLTTIYA